MSNNIKYVIFLILFHGSLFAQYTSKNSISLTKSIYTSSLKNTTKKSSSTSEPTTGLILKPTIGLGVGRLSFFGDVFDKKFESPSISRLAYELDVQQALTEYLKFNFYVLRGKLGANENYNTNGRHVNFESQITAGGVNLMYDFSNFLNPDRTASPYISIGIETFEFLSKTDKYDKYGNEYHYWKDGSIRNIAETSTNASSSTIIQRDYTYETDIRESNLDGFGKYHEHSWAIPVGIGFTFKLNDYLNFYSGATMHFTHTDYIDGITKNSVGNRQGNGNNDKFMMTSFGLSYNFGIKEKEEEEKLLDNLSESEMLALDKDDEDKDGVIDIQDYCPGTPTGVNVDAKGCPLDADKDGIPNYKDDEPNTPFGIAVDEKGVQLNDSILAYKYNVYMDSTGAFAKVETQQHNGRTTFNNLIQKEYSVSLGTFVKGLPPELMTKFLSINDISSTIMNDSVTSYNAGKFNNSLDAEKRKRQLVEMGLTDAKVVYKQNGKFVDAPVFTSNVTSPNSKESEKTLNNKDNSTIAKTTGIEKTTSTASQKENSIPETSNAKGSTSQDIILRVQLGAYSKRLSKNVFKDIDDIIEVKTENGLYKYMSGSYTTMDDAAKHKVELLMNGYGGAFITAYKGGKRISITEAGAKIAKKPTTEESLQAENSSAINKKLVVFRVQIGIFKNQIPDDKKATFEKIKDIEQVGTTSAGTRYVVGSFDNYEKAKAFKNDLIKNFGITDAFLVAFFNNNVISIPEAIELLK